jgi:lipopolysaccharide transport system permease protein
MTMPQAFTSAAGGSALIVRRLLQVFNPARMLAAAIDGATLLARHRRLALAMARRELTSRYAGQLMGSFWVGHPLFLMGTFVFLFAVEFQTKLGGSVEMPRDYTVYILSGLVPWLSILPVLTGGCMSILGNIGLVKQFNFEVEVLPFKDVLISLVFWVIGIAIIVVYTLATDQSLPWTFLMLPYLLAWHVVAMVGCAWLLSAITVFFRDLKDIINVLANLGVYMLPVVYLPQWVPEIFRPFIYANPFSYIIWVYQDVLYFGRFEHPAAWLWSTIFAVVAFTSGHRVFQRLRPLFGSAL